MNEIHAVSSFPADDKKIPLRHLKRLRGIPIQ
jgi:hypothetical protein